MLIRSPTSHIVIRTYISSQEIVRDQRMSGIFGEGERSDKSISFVDILIELLNLIFKDYKGMRLSRLYIFQLNLLGQIVIEHWTKFSRTEPRFLVGGADQFDVTQGKLGVWAGPDTFFCFALLVSCAAPTSTPRSVESSRSLFSIPTTRLRLQREIHLA